MRALPNVLRGRLCPCLSGCARVEPRGSLAGFLSLTSQRMVCVSDSPDKLILALATAELPDAAEKLGKLQKLAT